MLQVVCVVALDTVYRVLAGYDHGATWLSTARYTQHRLRDALLLLGAQGEGLGSRLLGQGLFTVEWLVWHLLVELLLQLIELD